MFLIGQKRIELGVQIERLALHRSIGVKGMIRVQGQEIKEVDRCGEERCGSSF